MVCFGDAWSLGAEHQSLIEGKDNFRNRPELRTRWDTQLAFQAINHKEGHCRQASLFPCMDGIVASLEQCIATAMRGGGMSLRSHDVPSY